MGECVCAVRKLLLPRLRRPQQLLSRPSTCGQLFCGVRRMRCRTARLPAFRHNPRPPSAVVPATYPPQFELVFTTPPPPHTHTGACAPLAAAAEGAQHPAFPLPRHLAAAPAPAPRPRPRPPAPARHPYAWPAHVPLFPSRCNNALSPPPMRPEHTHVPRLTLPKPHTHTHTPPALPASTRSSPAQPSRRYSATRVSCRHGSLTPPSRLPCPSLAPPSYLSLSLSLPPMTSSTPCPLSHTPFP